MVHKVPFTTGSYATSITPKPPFYLLVPSIHEIPEKVKKENKGKAFALGEFFGSDKGAEMAVRKAGYGKDKQRILKTQGYYRLKGEW